MGIFIIAWLGSSTITLLLFWRMQRARKERAKWIGKFGRSDGIEVEPLHERVFGYMVLFTASATVSAGLLHHILTKGG